MTELTADQTKLRQETILKAIEYGFTYQPIGNDTYLSAPLGKFEGEHYYVIHYYEAVMNGMAGETLYFGGDTAAMDLLDVTANETAAFELKPDTTYVALEYSEQGFVTLTELTNEQVDRLQREDELESEGDDEWEDEDEDDGDIVDDDLGTAGDEFFDSFNDF